MKPLPPDRGGGRVEYGGRTVRVGEALTEVDGTGAGARAVISAKIVVPKPRSREANGMHLRALHTGSFAGNRR